MPKGLLLIEWCLILIIVITTVVTQIINIIININLIFFIIILIIYIITVSYIITVEGGEGGTAHILQAFQGMGRVRQVQKWQLALKEKSADFKSPDLGSSAYALINYNHR